MLTLPAWSLLMGTGVRQTSCKGKDQDCCDKSEHWACGGEGSLAGDSESGWP